MCFHPIQQGDLILRQFGENAGFFIAFAQFRLHALNHIGNSGIPVMLMKCFEQIQLRVFFYLNPQVI